MYTDLILGTAGHIDHGKTSLVKALTGIDTDRLPEEKARGITIEPGFAQLRVGNHCLGIVDVPGHERFIRQMLSGATGMDMVMLVVDANESIKPQTIEHFEILRLLDLKHGAIVLTKCDLASEDWLLLVEEEIRQMVRDSFLTSAPIVRTSAVTRFGLEQLKQVLSSIADQVVAEQTEFRERAPFRMAIDRSFTLPGHGAIVTGSVATGHVEVGATLAVEPGGHVVRVRSLQNHDELVNSVHRGQRAAINIAGMDHSQIVRGHEIASSHHLVPSRIIAVGLQLLSSAPRSLKDNSRVRLHIGTAELAANVRLLHVDSLAPGERGMALVFLSEPAVATNQQSFVIRAESPAQTIGGGRVLNPNANRQIASSPSELERLAELGDSDDAKRLAASIYFAPVGQWRIEDAPRLAGVIDPHPILETIKADGRVCQVQVSPSQQVWVHAEHITQLGERIQQALDYLHNEHPLHWDFSLSTIEQRFDYLAFRAIFDAALRELKTQKVVEVRNSRISLVGRGPQLAKGERQLLDELLNRIRLAGIEPPDLNQLRAEAMRHKDAVPNLLALAVGAGDLHALTPELYVHSKTIDEVRKKLVTSFPANSGFTISQMREALSTSRKYAVPLAELLDTLGFTRRESDLRFIRADASASPLSATQASET